MVTWSAADFYAAWLTRMRSEPEERRGQAFFNTLERFDPSLAAMISGTAVDPFYKDHRIKVCADLLFGYGNEWDWSA